MQSPADLDLTDPALHAEQDLGELWRTLRTEEPLHWQPPAAGRPGFWSLTRYDDVVAAYRDTERLRSDHGNVLDTLLGGGDPAAGQMLPLTDGPRHADLRAALMKAFSPRALAAVVGNIRTASRDVLAQFRAKGSGDFARDVAGELPLRAICDLLDVPRADRARLLELTSSALGADSSDGLHENSWVSKSEILLYFCDLVADRRRRPREDIVSLLARCRIGGAPLSDEEVLFNCYSLILGGDETTRLALVGGVAALVDHPGQFRALREGASDVQGAVEEILRWTTPVLHAGRTAAVDFALHGRTVAAGDVVALWNVSANRDDTFAQPDRFRLDRTPNRHLTFAYGTHFCLGAFLARAEIAAVLEHLRDMGGTLHRSGPARPVYSNFLGGHGSLPLAWTDTNG
ncbi:cytochrome P450 [Streptomyces sp. MMG1121]|uniref:cytochrome P450 n=1 Tax=Streptomyces sp. MMG1121 TaxID=1415544 RepID=UPI0006AF1DD3|nr:cytochrome P450 [Streptomyces sp. MMG1121]KOV60600.1 cytochrome P450 [Streptomyces sp. MMG1121]